MAEYLRLKLMGFSDHEILAVRKELRDLRNRLRAQLGPLEGSAAEKRNRPRYAQDKVRAHYRRKYLVRGPQFSKEVLVCAYRENSLLSGIYPDREKMWRSFIERRTDRLDIDLKDFSFVTNPVETMTILQRIGAAECINANVMLNFEDEQCLDVGAYLILLAMRQRMIGVFHGGDITASMGDVFILLGLDSAMRMRLRKGDPDKQNVWPLRLQQRRMPGTTKSLRAQLDPSRAEKVLKTLVETLNRWLTRMATIRLSAEGERIARKMLGEALGNAEQHSDPAGDGNWSVAGYVSRRDVGDEEKFFFHLALFSPGKTIAESLQTCAADTRRALENYVRSHRGNGLTSEMLTTIFALQDGVTGDALAFQKGYGGTGLQDVLAFYATLSANADPESANGGMAIVSGSTCIQFKGPYVKGKLDFEYFEPNKPPPRTIWFNPQNSRDTAPDLEYVHDLPGKLQGTLISMAFSVDEAYLWASTNGDHNDQPGRPA